MLPDNPQAPPKELHSLPSLQPAPPGQSVPAPVTRPMQAQPLQSPAQDALNQAKILVSQYKNNPHQLSLSLQQVKTQYLAKQFGINTDQSQK